MVYSTCTINPGENQENVAWFLGKHPEFELLDMEQIYPGTQVGDGFFYARLRRISSPPGKKMEKRKLCSRKKQISNP